MTDGPQTFRPALVTLTNDVRSLAREFRAGLDSERRVLEWFQEITVGTLGMLDDIVYTDLATQFRTRDGVTLPAYINASRRPDDLREVNPQVASKLRQRFLADYLHPAHRDAFRDLRGNATEYIDDAGDGDAHNPDRQRYVAMRPALSELRDRQERTLGQLLDGFEDESEILDWGHDILLATHGELEREWTSRLVGEQATFRLLTGQRPQDKRARHLFAAHHVLPQFREGVRVLSNRAGETADAEQERKEANFA